LKVLPKTDFGVMDFKKIYENFRVSFEVFPPKNDEGEKTLFNELSILSAYNPAYISVTYGAGGSTRDKTFEIAVKIKKTLGIPPLVHFTCVGSGFDEIKKHLNQALSMGLTDILALRGDPSDGQKEFIATNDGFTFAKELVECIRKTGDFSIVVAGYPEKHPEAKSFKEDILNLKQKIDAGAELVITQFFFNNDDYYNLVDKLHSLQCDVPVIPGMLPIVSLSQVEKFAYLTGATIPSALRTKFEKCKTPEDITAIGIEHCTEQCRDLKQQKVKGFHMYCLNKSYAVKKVLDAVGI
jgi:methylenetetrahydrofolate reductase (NADPH)